VVVILDGGVPHIQSFHFSLSPVGSATQRRMKLHSIANACHDSSNKCCSLAEWNTAGGLSRFAAKTHDGSFCAFGSVHTTVWPTTE